LVSKAVGSDSDVEHNRQNRLEKRDEVGIQDGSIHEAEDISDEDAEKEKDLTSLSSAMRTITVLGQIIKNYPGDIDGDLKVRIIDEIHKLGMRIVEAMLTNISLLERDLIKYIIEKVKDKSTLKTSYDVILITKNIFSGIIAKMTRGMINNIAICLSNEALLYVIQETFNNSDSISQKLIMQELKFNVLKKPNVNEVIEFANELEKGKNTDFAAIILRSIVANYLSYNRCGHKIREQLCAKFELSSQNLFIESNKQCRQI